MDGFERREKQEELARQREEASSSRVAFRVVEDRGWASSSDAHGARIIVIAPVTGQGYSPEVDDVLELSGKKHDARRRLDQAMKDAKEAATESRVAPGMERPQ